MDDKERFDIRRMVIEADMDFEQYIAKQQAEIDRLVKENKFITEGSNRALKAQQAEIEGLVDAIIDSGKYKEDAELRSIIARYRGKNVNIKALCK